MSLLVAVTLGSGCGAVQSTEQAAPVAQHEAALHAEVVTGPAALGPRYGISAALPAGWEGTIRRGALYAASFAVPGDHLACWVEMACPRLAAADARLVLYENGRDNRSPPLDPSQYPLLSGPLRFGARDFDASDGNSDDSLTTGHGFARRTFQLSGRLFVVFAETGSRPPATQMLAALNELLASLRVEPGDFFPGTVEPARFPARPGWYTGTSGADKSDGDGEFTTSWAATAPYADEWNALPMSRTLERLPSDGIVIWLGLSRNNRLPPRPAGSGSFPAREPPFSLAQFERHEMWEGQIRDLPEYVLWGTVAGQYQIDLRIYFGRPEPTDEQLAHAQAMLDALELPDWGPWES